MASAASRALPALMMGGRNVFMQRAGETARRQLPGNCIQQFCFRGDNHLARFVANTKNLDKAFKFAKSVSEFSCGVIEGAGAKGVALDTAKNVTGALGLTRNVVGLANVMNGCVPGLVKSSKSCFEHIKQCFAHPEGYNLGSVERPMPYNKLFLTKGDHALMAVKEGCSAIGAATYIATFGVSRPILLANKLAGKSFLSEGAKAGLGDSVNYMMTANHAAGVIGGVAALAYESRAYTRASDGVLGVAQDEQISPEVFQQVSQELKTSHAAALKKIILGILEKAFEFLADLVKLIPFPFSAPTRLAVTAGFVTISSGIGLYSVWSNS
ncbi:hypothetical protein [Chlamydia vaughanii]|uniref:CT529 family inclusion membrane protein n=1 Tax=Chlamydia vaughanii TaxID=3112552 RepID=UPI0032B14C76